MTGETAVGMWTLEFRAAGMDVAQEILRAATPPGEIPMTVNEEGRLGFECTGSWPQVERLRTAVWARGTDCHLAEILPERYRVDVHVGEFMGGSVIVLAHSRDDAKAKAVEAVKSAPIEVVSVWKED
jgi:hypothetical protein